MNRTRLALLFGFLVAGGAALTLLPHGKKPAAVRAGDRRCRGICRDSSVLRVLSAGPSASQIASTAPLLTTNGVAVTTTRASPKYCRAANGSLVLLGNDVACVEAAGLFLEAPATNLVFWSQALENAAYTQSAVTVTADQAAAPDGTTTADKVATTVGGSVLSNATATASVVTYTGSAWVKTQAGTVNGFLRLKDSGGTFTASQSFTATTTWQKITVTGPSVAAGNLGLFIQISSASSFYYVWQAQLELGSVASSPILTGASAVTRAADTVSIPMTGLLAGTGSMSATITPTWTGAGPSGTNYFLGTAANTFMYEPSTSAPASFLTGTGASNTSTSGTFASGTPKTYWERWDSGAGTSLISQFGGTSGSQAFTGLTDVAGPLLVGATVVDSFWIHSICASANPNGCPGL